MKETHVEESLRLKEYAEKKFSLSKFKSALKYAKRAQNLHPKLHGISQMVATFQAHCAAHETLDGDPDWYAILQVEPFSHINTIRKQYKKLALILHPDKNKCVGSEDAFKLVGKAWSILSDKLRKQAYDLKRRISLEFQVESVEPIKKVESFWTACTTCRVFHEFDRKYVGHMLTCPFCKKSFLAVEVNTKTDKDSELGSEKKKNEELGVQRENGKRKLGSNRVEELSGKRTYCSDGKSLSSGVLRDGASERSAKTSSGLAGNGVGKRRARKSLRPSRTVVRKMNAKPSDRNVGSGELDENLAEFLRTRVSEESINPKVKRKRVHEISEKPTNLPVTKRSEQPLSNAKRSTGAIISSDCMLMTVGDSDFYDFDNDRMEECFKKSQIWAVYDDDDGMPRHYALIEEVTSIDPFVVQISWLDIEINGDLSLILWEKSGYHTACGLFRTVRKATIESVNVFSHLISGERAMREIYRIYPMQGSIWALYRDLDSRKEDHLRGESQRAYDIVVSLTSFSEDYGISVAYLERVKGFKAVFKRSETGAHAVRLIEKDEVRQFSHQVPARTLSGTEDPYLPGECWELDPASLPSVGLVSS